MTVRTRFAPSPTGYLHIGGARTALYSYLYAKHCGGQFILRIEDTDRERSTQEAVDAILQGMEWLGLQHDEGPFFQTQHMNRYRQVIDQLLETGHAYRCYCSVDRLKELRDTQLASKVKPRYDGMCRSHGAHSEPKENTPYVIRFRNPQTGATAFDDLVRGTVSFDNAELDDLIIARTDGTPTYNLTVVVDDWDMKITHVIRGDDHINNTPRQINILKALGAPLPHYAHIPMILGEDGKRLSKRHGAVSVLAYREAGYLPEALLNYLVRLGWSHGDQEIFSLQEMIDKFDLTHLNNSPASFNTQKLDWINQHYLKTLPPETVAAELLWQFTQQHIATQNGPPLTAIVSAQAERCKTLKEMAEKSAFFFQDITEYDAKAMEKNLSAATIPVLEHLYQAFSALNEWHAEQLHHVIQAAATTLNVKLGQVAQPLRIAVTGGTVSPSIDITLALLGKEKVLARIKAIIPMCQ